MESIGAGASGLWRWRCWTCWGPKRLQFELGMKASTRSQKT